MNVNCRRFARWVSSAVLIAGIGAAALAAPAACAQNKVRIVYSSSPTGTSFFLQAVQHMSAIAKLSGYDIIVQESAGTEENMARMERQKTAQLGAMDAVLLKAKYGENTDIRMFANYTPLVWQIIVAEDANVRKLSDLSGKKFNSGPTGGGSTKITLAILAALGIKQDEYEATMNDALEAYADRRIIGLSYRGTGANVIGGVVEANATRPVTFVPFSDAEIDVARKLYPSLTKAYIQANVYQRQPNAIPTIGTWQGGQIGVRKDVPADVVYNLVKAYFATIPEVGKTHRGLATVTEENSVSEAVIPLHPGAIRYYREKGIVIPDRLIPPEGK